ncbi:hypothetical protein E2C01_081507 [Portunus trituberculatus]|uniref:Uncharacterized protein n=1 Tax=Portunus trituberculatus TaxID=210409 RepID=A0A5B7IMG0_PORTR|nr:hypothetical protein [Portunus trituberculatus]
MKSEAEGEAPVTCLYYLLDNGGERSDTPSRAGMNHLGVDKFARRLPEPRRTRRLIHRAAAEAGRPERSEALRCTGAADN